MVNYIGQSGLDLVRRPHVEIEKLRPYLDFDFKKEIGRLVEINVKYEGYINKALKSAEKINKMEFVKIPEDINYDEVPNLALEAKDKFKEIRPFTLGQASRISGVNPSDISVLAMYVTRK